MYIRALRATSNGTDHSYNPVSLPTSQLKSFVVIPAWLKFIKEKIVSTYSPTIYFISLILVPT